MINVHHRRDVSTSCCTEDSQKTLRLDESFVELCEDRPPCVCVTRLVLFLTMKNESGKMLTKVSIYFVLLTSLYMVCGAENISIGLMGFFHGHSHVVFLSKIGAAVPVAIDKINKNSTIMENVFIYCYG